MTLAGGRGARRRRRWPRRGWATEEREREPEDLSLSRWKREREGAGKISLSLDGREKARENWNFPRLIGLPQIPSRKSFYLT